MTRKDNLRVVKHVLTCQHCKEKFEHFTKAPGLKKKYCDPCVQRRKKK